MGKLYWLNWKLYLKTIYLSAVYLLLLGYGVVLSLKHLAAREYLMLFQNGLTSILAQLGMLCFTFFLFEAYEFLHKSRDRDLQESLRSINSGDRKTVVSQLLVLLSLVLLTFLLAAAVMGFCAVFSEVLWAREELTRGEEVSSWGLAVTRLGLGAAGEFDLDRAIERANRAVSRAESIREEYAKLGIEVDLDAEDTMKIRGGRIRGGHVHSHDDHRIAMSLAVAALNADTPVVIENPACVAKSFPDFFERLESLRTVE